MRATSMYSLDCVCGHDLESKGRVLVCPGCKRLIEIDWPATESSDDSSDSEQQSHHSDHSPPHTSYILGKAVKHVFDPTSSPSPKEGTFSS